MSDGAERCPTCSTMVPAGSARCPGCGRVFGEDNRCPSCHAIAAVQADGDGFVCVACGKPRERKPGTTVLGGPARTTLAPRPTSLRGRALRGLGVLTIGTGVLGAAISTALFGATLFGLLVAAGVATAFGLVGLRLLRGASGADESIKKADLDAAAAKVRAAARALGGEVTAKAVADKLGVSEAEADQMLTAMAKNLEASLEVDTDTGAVHYVFPEIVAARPKVRVEAGPPDGAAESPVEARDAERAERRSRI